MPGDRIQPKRRSPRRRPGVRARGPSYAWIATLLIGLALIASLFTYAFLLGSEDAAPGASSTVQGWHAIVERNASASYTNVSHSCSAAPQLNQSGLERVCTTTFRAAAQVLGTPYYVIFSVYEFGSQASATAFLSSLSEDINTTPWFTAGSQYANQNATYTTLLYRNFGFTTSTEASLSEYIESGARVFTASTSNLTAEGDLTAIKENLSSDLMALMATGSP